MKHIGPRPTAAMYQSGREIDCQCARCGSSIYSEECDHCEDGFSGHECGEDVCCCRFPEENVPCDLCSGSGVHRRCLSSPAWCEANPLQDREHVRRGEIEWFVVEEFGEGVFINE